MPKPSRWKTGHAACEAAALAARAELAAEVERLRAGIQGLYDDCLNQAGYIKGPVGAELESVANKLTDLLNDSEGD
jgi:hypothetical protein